MKLPRATWTNLTEDQLLAQCAVDTYRASGPGGQKRENLLNTFDMQKAIDAGAAEFYMPDVQRIGGVTG